MYKFIKVFLIVFFITLFVSAQEEREILIEVFTNSHCPLCPPAHNALDSYDQNGDNADRISYIFYHIRYPYPDDALYEANTSDSDGRNNYYGPYTSSPKAFFNGAIQQNNYNSWSDILDGISLDSPLKITLTGVNEENAVRINAEVSRSGDIPEADLVIHFVLVENVNYQGSNGIAYHKNVMRKMVTSPTGEGFLISIGETKQVEKTISINGEWIFDNLGIVVFIQSNASKTVYQSATINYDELSDPTDVKDFIQPEQFQLHQNYPNPFNPSTKITYILPEEASVKLIVYNVLGKEIVTIVNENQQAGFYEYTFDAEGFNGLSSGVYLYRLTAVNLNGKKAVQTRKMTLIK